MKKTFVFLFLILPLIALADNRKTDNVLLITLDGLRWQELFFGADSILITDSLYVENPGALTSRFWVAEPLTRRKMLLPFFWNVIAGEGQLYGNRLLGCNVNVTNHYWFSYPGYSELLTGYRDDSIDSNDKVANPNQTVLEFVNQVEHLKGKVAAFASWDVFPYIINEKRSGIWVNAGFRSAQGQDLSAREIFLNELQDKIPSPWSTVRLDAFTHHYALEYLKKHHPRFLYIAYGETDDFAHDGKYDSYLDAAHRTDSFIAQLWNWIQADEVYKNKTTLLITTDHGRGTKGEWTGHGTSVAGSDQIWFTVIGPDTKSLGEVRKQGQYYLNQIAKTAAGFLGIDYQNQKKVGETVSQMMIRRSE